MKNPPAIAVVEFKDIAVGIVATDAMLKKSPIAFLKCGTISRGRYLTLIGGTTASVEEAINEGLFWGGANVLDHVLLADVHPQVYDAILGQRRPIGPPPRPPCAGASPLLLRLTVQLEHRRGPEVRRGVHLF